MLLAAPPDGNRNPAAHLLPTSSATFSLVAHWAGPPRPSKNSRISVDGVPGYPVPNLTPAWSAARATASFPLVSRRSTSCCCDMKLLPGGAAKFRRRNRMCRDKKDSKRNPSGMALLLIVLVSASHIACNGSSGPVAGTGGRANTGGATISGGKGQPIGPDMSTRAPHRPAGVLANRTVVLRWARRPRTSNLSSYLRRHCR